MNGVDTQTTGTPADPRLDVSKCHVHWRSIITFIILWVSVVSFGVCMTSHDYSEVDGVTTDTGCAANNNGTLGFFLIALAIYLVEIWKSDTLKFLSNVHTTETAEAYTNRIHAVPPRPIQWIRYVPVHSMRPPEPHLVLRVVPVQSEGGERAKHILLCCKHMRYTV